MSNKWENDKPENYYDVIYLSGRFNSIVGNFFAKKGQRSNYDDKFN